MVKNGEYMAKIKNSVTEFRSYYLPLDFPVLLLSGEHWKISDVPSGRLHFHNCLEIGVCHSFSGTLEVCNDSYRFREGDVTCLPKNVPHTTYSDPDTESRWSYLFFDPDELFKGWFPKGTRSFDLAQFPVSSIKPIIRKEAYPSINTLALNAIVELENKQPGYQLITKGLLFALYMEIFRIQAEGRQDEKSGPLADNILVISPALDFIEASYMNSFSMEDLADICHLSPTHFRRTFHSIMGTSPLDYVNNVRIMKACNLLRTTEDSILSISEMVGFHSISSFNRSFLEKTQMSPRNYRETMKQADKRIEHQIISEYSGWTTPERPNK